MHVDMAVQELVPSAPIRTVPPLHVENRLQLGPQHAASVEEAEKVDPRVHVPDSSTLLDNES